MLRSSIIIPVFNKSALTRQCLDTLFMNPDSGLEIIVVNDASTDNTAGLLESYGDKIRVVTHSNNKGFAVSCNDGAALARGEFLVFLNNDTIPEPGWLDALVNYAIDHPKAGAVGAKLLFPDNTIQHAGVVILSQNRYPSHIYTGFPGDHPAVNKSRRFQVVTAGCVLIRRTAFQQAEGFDAAYHNGYEDVDLCLRLGEMGYEVHYCHESVLYHLESRTRDTVSPVQLSNEKLYEGRWIEKVHPDDFLYYIEDGLFKVHCPPRYPIYFEASPQLAINSPWANPEHADQMLYSRARQVYDLLQENLGLLVRAHEAEDVLSQMSADGGDRNALHSASPPTIDANKTDSVHKRGRARFPMAGSKLDSNADDHGAGDHKNRLPETNSDILSDILKAEIEVLKAQHACDRLRIVNLRETLLDVHRKLLHRDDLLMQAYQIKTGESGKTGLDHFQGNPLGLYTDRTVRELLGFLDKLDLAVGKIYRTRRWKWANPVMILRRLLAGSGSIRGYWHIDDTLAEYKEWRKKQPGIKS